MAGTKVNVTFDNVTSAAQLVALIGKTIKTNLVTQDGYTCEASGTTGFCGLFGTSATCTIDTAKFTGSGATDQPTSIGTDTTKTEAIQNGNCSASMNGQTVYVPCTGTASTSESTKTDSTGTTTSTGTTSTTKNADGTTTTTTTKTTTNPDGSTSTTSTSCTGNNCTSSTTTKDAQGNTTGSSSTTDTKEGFCAENPEAPVCKRSTFNAAPCGEVPSCEGDAVQCAMARQQHQDSCKFFSPDTDTNSLANQAIAGIDGFNPENMKANAEGIDVGSFDSSGSGWPRSCPTDYRVDFQGSSFEIPFSKVCPLLSVMAQIAVAITLLGCLTWVARGDS